MHLKQDLDAKKKEELKHLIAVHEIKRDAVRKRVNASDRKRYQ